MRHTIAPRAVEPRNDGRDEQLARNRTTVKIQKIANGFLVVEPGGLPMSHPDLAEAFHHVEEFFDRTEV